MVSSKKIKEIAGDCNKKISRKAIDKINILLNKRAENIVKQSKKNADFAGRKIINEGDIIEI